MDSDKILLPRTEEEISEWVDWFYKYDPVVQQFVDHVHFGHPTREQARDIILPHLKSLAYRLKLRDAELRKHMDGEGMLDPIFNTEAARKVNLEVENTNDE